MLYLITGPAGSGKTEFLYAELEQAYCAGIPCVWIAPEQQSVQAEREILARLGDGCNLSVEILNFERLPERIAREHGDLAVTYPDRGALCALLSVLAAENKGKLQEYASCAEDADFIDGLFGLFGRLRSERIRPEDLQKAAESGLLESERLKAKVADIALLYGAYDAYFDETRRDPRDALSVLAEQLPEKPFFAGKAVFVDGYYTFTGQEYAVLAQILRQARTVYCSATCDGREIFEGNEACAQRLAKLAGGHRVIPMGEYRRSQKEELRFLEKHLWSEETPAYEGEPQALRLVKAENLFGEAEAVASEILRLVRAGYRYREITVLARHAESYAGILDAVLRQNHIPFFFAEKDELLSHPLVSFLCAALELVTTDFSLYAVRKYLKSGYAGALLSPEECDQLLRYAESWGLRGREWYGDAPWARNPDGYREGGLTEAQSALLAAVNVSREALRPGWNALLASLRQKPLTGRKILQALYAHLEQMGASALYVEKVNALLQNGDVEQAEKDSQLWKLLMGIFDRLDELCGEKSMTPRRMLSLLTLTVRQYSLGSIPPSQDSVTVGEAALLRPDRARAVIVMGCNDGVFPAMVGSDPLFGDAEAVQLEGAGLAIVEPRLSRLREERFYFYSAAAAPSEALIFTYPSETLGGEELRPSPAILRIRALFPQLGTILYTGTGEQALFSAENASSAFRTLPEGKDRDRLRALLEEKGITPPASRAALSDPEARIDYDSRNLRLSPSGLERYRYCPFSYFGSHLLRLKEKQRNRFASPEIGTFIHKILERFLSLHTADGQFVPPASAEELERETDALTAQYLSEVTGGEHRTDKRFLHTCRNLRKLLLLLLGNLSGEFAGSRFRPVGFEVGIGMGPDGLPAVRLPLEGGKTASLCGVIDRVDVYERDGVRYARVVDYKTYEKNLRLDYARAYGLDEQMLLYLFAYCRAASDGKTEIRPAGALYNLATLPFVDAIDGESAENLQKRLESKLKRTGVILEDTDIARAMDGTEKGAYLPARFGRDGTLTPGDGTLPAEEFASLGELLEQQLRETAEQIFGGSMDVCPLELDDKHRACTYCKMRPACRRGRNDMETEEE